MEICGDNRFEIIAKAKEHLLEATSIADSEDEMKVLDDFLFRCWQMGWLDRYDDRKTEPLNQDLAKNEPTLVKDLVNAFGEDGTWLERQGVYTLTLAEAKQRAVDIIESVLAKTEPQKKEVEWVYNKRESLWYPYSNGELLFKDEPQVVMPKKCKGCDSASKIIEAYSKGWTDGSEAAKAMPQTDYHDLTDCDFCKDRNCKDCEGGKDEPQTDYRIDGTIGYKCPKCGRGNFLNNESNCIYCGTLLIKTDPQMERISK